MAKIFETMAGGWAIIVTRTGRTFTIQYGLQVKKNLTREQAYEELGACIFHGLECDGKLNT